MNLGIITLVDILNTTMKKRKYEPRIHRNNFQVSEEPRRVSCISRVYRATSKDVMAALRLSFASRSRGGVLKVLQDEIIEEWSLQNLKGLVEQKPPTWLVEHYVKNVEAGLPSCRIYLYNPLLN